RVSRPKPFIVEVVKGIDNDFLNRCLDVTWIPRHYPQRNMASSFDHEGVQFLLVALILTLDKSVAKPAQHSAYETRAEADLRDARRKLGQVASHQARGARNRMSGGALPRGTPRTARGRSRRSGGMLCGNGARGGERRKSEGLEHWLVWEC